MKQFLVYLCLLLLVVPAQAQEAKRSDGAIQHPTDTLAATAKTRQKLAEWHAISDAIQEENIPRNKELIVKQVSLLDSLQDVVALYYNSLFWDYLRIECEQQKITPRSTRYKGYDFSLLVDTIPVIKSKLIEGAKYGDQYAEFCRADSAFAALDDLKPQMNRLAQTDTVRINWQKKREAIAARLRENDPRIAKMYETARKSVEDYTMDILDFLIGWFRQEKIWLPYGDMVSNEWVPFLHKRYADLFEVEQFRRTIRGLANRCYLNSVAQAIGFPDVRKDYEVDTLQQALKKLDSLQARHDVIFAHCVWDRYLQRTGRTHKTDKLIAHFKSYADSALVDTIPHLASLHRIRCQEAVDYNRLLHADPEYPTLEQEREKLKGLPEKHFSRTLYRAHEDEVRERIYRKNPSLMQMRKKRTVYRDQFYLALIRELNEDSYRRGVTLLPIEWIDSKEVGAVMAEYGDAKRLMERYATFRILRTIIGLRITQKDEDANKHGVTDEEILDEL